MNGSRQVGWMALAIGLAAVGAWAQDAKDRRIAELEAQNRRLVDELDRLKRQVLQLSQRDRGTAAEWEARHKEVSAENARLWAQVRSLQAQMNLLFSEALMKAPVRPAAPKRAKVNPYVESRAVIADKSLPKIQWVQAPKDVFQPEPRAKKVMFLIDASGSLMGTMPFIQREVTRAIERLSEEQMFDVIFFQKGEALGLPSPNLGWKSADALTKKQAKAWLSHGAGNVVARGKTDPRPAIRMGFGAGPDVVHLLSDRITGQGQLELHQPDLLKLIAEVAPKNVRVHTVQWLEDDQLKTMLEIARRYRGTARWITPDYLGLPPR